MSISSRSAAVFASPVLSALPRRALPETRGKTVLVRADLNVPRSPEGKLLSPARILDLKPLLLQIPAARVLLCSHFGRPKGREPSLSLATLVPDLERLLDRRVLFLGDPRTKLEGKAEPAPIILFENLRFYPEETDNDPDFARQIARNADLYVNEAFSVCHRAHASVCAITRFLPSYAGPSLWREVEALSDFLSPSVSGTRTMALLGGAKVSTKIALLHSMVEHLHSLCLGGGIANTFLAAQGFSLGESYVETDYLPEARALLKRARQRNCRVLLPCDGVLRYSGKDASRGGEVVGIDSVPAWAAVVDLGPRSARAIEAHILDSGINRVIVNGPLGLFEQPPYDRSTLAVFGFLALQTSRGVLETLAGGGDTLAALERADAVSSFTHASAGGGAFLAFLEEGDLPGLRALRAQTLPLATSERSRA